MTVLPTILRIWDHLRWADEELLKAVESCPEARGALREFAHVLAAEEVWLARLEARPSRVPVWPNLDAAQARELSAEVHRDYGDYLAKLDRDALSTVVRYTNSAGREFETPIGDILLHVALHGQYHRGKVNLLLRESGCRPAPVDFIGFVRGEPAAVTPVD